MSGITNSDNGMMKNQQEADLRHSTDEDEAPALKGAEIESPIPRLPEGVNADGMVESAHDDPELDPATDRARLDAIEAAAEAPMPSD